jgi:hypothetical protein
MPAQRQAIIPARRQAGRRLAAFRKFIPAEIGFQPFRQGRLPQPAKGGPVKNFDPVISTTAFSAR